MGVLIASTSSSYAISFVFYTCPYVVKDERGILKTWLEPWITPQNKILEK